MKKVIIIGGGIAGLSAGCYLQMNQYETEIFELHKAGGLCSSWKRGDYLIDGCLHWLVGINPKTEMYQMWNELIDIKTLPLTVYQEFNSLEKGGKVIRQYGDLDRLQKELTEISPEDEKVILEMISGARKFADMDLLDTHTFSGKAKKTIDMVQMIATFKKWMVPTSEYAKKIKSPDIREFLLAAFPDSPMIIFLMNASWFHNKNAGYPEGGGQEIVKRLIKRYESLGGKLHEHAKVNKILVEENRVNGVELQNKQTVSADIVVSAADGHDTIYNMLGEKYEDKKIKELYYDKKYIPKTSGIFLSLGVARSFTETYKPYVIFPVKKPLVIDGKEVKYLSVTIHNFDPKAAPKGKTVLTVLMQSTDPQYWCDLREKDPKEYARQKKQIADKVTDELDRHFGNIKNKLEATDITTPATYIRLTNNWNGALMGWQDTALFFHKPHKQIEGLHNFYMCGQWTGDVGLPGAAQSGRIVTQLICKNDHHPFRVLD